MRNPNGYGSVIKMSGNRRNPFAVRVTNGWDDEGKQLYRYLGYYPDRPTAMIALAEYNKNPLQIDASSITFKEVYDKWSTDKYEKIHYTNANGYRAAYVACGNLDKMPFAEIRKIHLQKALDQSGFNPPMQKKFRTLLNQMYKYAMENDIVDKNYAQFVETAYYKKSDRRIPFTDFEIKRLFKDKDQEGFELADTILIMIYTGLRIGELLTINKSDVDIKNRVIIGGMKTEAGRNRVIPINKKILPLIQERYSHAKEYLIEKPNGKKYEYYLYNRHFKILMKLLKASHSPHDCRHTFATLMSNAGANTNALQKIIGHAHYSTTADIYTHKDINELIQAIDCI
ncbi:MAG: site-specific integrase [Bacteroidia bacterium]|nr:site-specific integrase [Bacteroidia bacterium]